ncbi:hypothetical protein [Halobacillus kuroshimensis]|uniref:hypothetical protein n=1 Tax=Halobacillus kuroshimensis TaxID=302481 RepID=UPI0004254B1D|nr:hypothetical protein [Halobacillus kuroshimensis]
MNIGKLLLWIAGIALIFGGGYAAAVYVGDTPSYTLTAVKAGENKETSATLHNGEHQAELDTMLNILLHQKPMEGASVDMENPDVTLKLISPERSIGILDARVWFEEDRAVLGIRSGQTWNSIRFSELSQNEASYIRSIVGEE